MANDSWSQILQKLEEKLSSMTKSILAEFHEKHEQAITELFSEQKNSITEELEVQIPNLNLMNISYDLNETVNSNNSSYPTPNSTLNLISSDLESDLEGLKSEIIKHQEKEITLNVDSSSSTYRTSNGGQPIVTNGGNRKGEVSFNLPFESQKFKLHFEELVQGQWDSISTPPIFDTGQSNLHSEEEKQSNVFDWKFCPILLENWEDRVKGWISFRNEKPNFLGIQLGLDGARGASELAFTFSSSSSDMNDVGGEILAILFGIFSTLFNVYSSDASSAFDIELGKFRDASFVIEIEWETFIYFVNALIHDWDIAGWIFGIVWLKLLDDKVRLCFTKVPGNDTYHTRETRFLLYYAAKEVYKRCNDYIRQSKADGGWRSNFNDTYLGNPAHKFLVENQHNLYSNTGNIFTKPYPSILQFLLCNTQIHRLNKNCRIFQPVQQNKGAEEMSRFHFRAIPSITWLDDTNFFSNTNSNSAICFSLWGDQLALIGFYEELITCVLIKQFWVSLFMGGLASFAKNSKCVLEDMFDVLKERGLFRKVIGDWILVKSQSFRVQSMVSSSIQTLLLERERNWKAAYGVKPLVTHMTDRVFNIGDWVYIKLQPYRQQSAVQGSNQKLAPLYFGPYRVEDKIGEAAYKLKLPQVAVVHPVFHVSQLKKKVNDQTITAPYFPLDFNATTEVPILVDGLERKMVKRGNQAATKVLIQWSNSSVEDSTWEFADDIHQRFPDFVNLEDKVL